MTIIESWERKLVPGRHVVELENYPHLSRLDHGDIERNWILATPEGCGHY